MFGRTLRMAFWVGYDHLGRLMLCNLAWFCAAAPFAAALPWALRIGDARLAALAAALLALGAYMTLTAAAAATAHLVKTFIERRDGGLGLFAEGLRLYGLQGAGLGLVTGLAAAVFVAAMIFYGALAGRVHPWLGAAVGGLFGWLLLAAAMTAFYAVPAIVQTRRGLREALRLGALLALGNPLLSLGLGMVALLWTALAVAVPPVLAAGAISGLTVLASCAYELLARKYAVDTEGVTVLASDAEDDYLNRGIKDLLYPWKS